MQEVRAIAIRRGDDLVVPRGDTVFSKMISFMWLELVNRSPISLHGFVRT